MKIVFMGTPDFARGVLESIYECGQHEITAVVTQPDRPKGRSNKMISSPVKEYAIEKGIPVMTPERIKTAEAVEELAQYEADIYVVAAFGQILSSEILNMPRYGCINVHASLLPEYRGAAPIQWAIADGRTETGVTIMQMNEGLDTGDILTQTVVAITAEETGESLFDKLMIAGAKLIVDTLGRIERNEVVPIPQDENRATYAKILKKEMGCIDFLMSAQAIEHRIRAFTPWPGGYTYLNGKVLKIKSADAVDANTDKSPGTIVSVNRDEIQIACGEGLLSVTQLQPEGKKSMSTHDFLLGNAIEAGIVLGQ